MTLTDLRYSNKNVYELTTADFNRLLKKDVVDFARLKKSLFEDLAYEIYEFEQTATEKDQDPGQLQMEHIKTVDEAIAYMRSLNNVK